LKFLFKFPSGLSPSLRSQVQGQILRGDSILTLTVTFSKVMCVFTEADVSPAPFIEQSNMISGRGRDRCRGRGRYFGEHGSFRGGHESYDGKQSGFDKKIPTM